MELKWIEDYIALVKHGSFSKAAEARFVTQPAFSRRIRSLENWLGVSLVNRSKYPSSFTEAGTEFIKQAEAMKNQIYSSRDHLKALENSQTSIKFLSQHSLAVSFLPSWLQDIEPVIDNTLLKVSAANLHDSVESFIAGSADFLLCFSSHDISRDLDRTDIESINVGADRLIPVTGVRRNGHPIYSATQKEPLRLLHYPRESFFGQLFIRQCLPQLEVAMQLHRVCENALAEGLKALVGQGYGVAWLPQCMVEKELKEGSMMILEIPQASADLQIKLYRFKDSASHTADVFWNYLCELYNPDYSFYNQH